MKRLLKALGIGFGIPVVIASALTAVFLLIDVANVFLGPVVGALAAAIFVVGSVMSVSTYIFFDD